MLFQNNKDKQIEFEKELSKLHKELKSRAKGSACVLCGKEMTSFCKSHSVPQFILKNIAIEGKLIPYSRLMDGKESDELTGVSSAMTFHNICKECDKRYFADYESEEALLKGLNDKMLAEIALKNHLLMLYKWRIDKEFTLKAKEEHMPNVFYPTKEIYDELTLKDNAFDIQRTKKIIDNGTEKRFAVLFNKTLDWKAPVCIQTQITLEKDIKGATVNNILSLSEKNRIQVLHLCVFPFKTKTLILLFHHKNDKAYREFDKQFKQLSLEKKIEYINYLIFAHTEHAFVSPNASKRAITNKNLRKLCYEGGTILSFYDRGIKPTQIPNFLSEKMKCEDIK